MAKIVAAEAGFYRVPLPVVLTDSTHGEMRGFELNTVRLRGADGSDAQISSLVERRHAKPGEEQNNKVRRGELLSFFTG